MLPHLRPIWESEGWKDRATRSCLFSAARWRVLSISQAWAGRCTTCTPPGRPNDIDQIDNLWDVVVAKMIWPIPDKGQNKRIHRIIAPSLNVWGENGRLIPPVYAHTFRKAINNAEMWSRTAARTMRGIDCARAGILWRVRSGWRWASGLINSRNFRTEDLKMPRSPRIVGIPSSPFQNCLDARVCHD